VEITKLPRLPTRSPSILWPTGNPIAVSLKVNRLNLYYAGSIVSVFIAPASFSPSSDEVQYPTVIEQATEIRLSTPAQIDENTGIAQIEFVLPAHLEVDIMYKLGVQFENEPLVFFAKGFKFGIWVEQQQQQQRQQSEAQLIRAIGRNDLSAVRRLVDSGVDISDRVINAALNGNNKDIVEYLFKIVSQDDAVSQSPQMQQPKQPVAMDWPEWDRLWDGSATIAN
jgi:hypothetical protein